MFEVPGSDVCTVKVTEDAVLHKTPVEYIHRTTPLDNSNVENEAHRAAN